ncbi:hypothetical protein [Methylotenera sp. L2L1]|uniref:hypothetical protein n=1 Tax=Methylotenera sp. L2L1 TaxID=1502770 RepID=UPI00056BFB07|nr:hypothetical protein [Methylotenera sp. L2L1]
MQNYLVIYDENGEIVNFEFIKKTLSNLNRFNELLPETRGLVHKLINDGYRYETERLKVISEDFFGAWQLSSTELISHTSKEICIEYLMLFKSLWVMAWPSTSLDIIEEYGTDWELEIFRGESPSLEEKNIQGISWTLRKSVAEEYAVRYHDGVVLTGKIKWDDVLWISPDEDEVIVSSSWRR